MKNLIKTILSIFLLSFASQNANAAVVKPLILQKNISDTIVLEQKQAIKPKKGRIDVSEYVMKGSLVLGGIFLISGLAELNSPCIQTSTSKPFDCLSGYGWLALSAIFIFLGALLALFRGMVFLASKKKNKNNLQKNTQK